MSLDFLAARSRPRARHVEGPARDGETEIVVLPMTHAMPGTATPAIELPSAGRAHLGVDEERSRAILAKCNLDLWPSPDIAPLPGKPGVFAYSHLPPGLFLRIPGGFVPQCKAKRLRLVPRGG